MRFGWIPDGPDMRDYTSSHPSVKTLLAKARPLKFSPSGSLLLAKSAPKTPLLPSKIDLRYLCPPIVDQGELGSCTANAARVGPLADGAPTRFGALIAAGIVGFFQLGSMRVCEPVSRLFIYKCARALLMSPGDSGATIRSTQGPGCAGAWGQTTGAHPSEALSPTYGLQPWPLTMGALALFGAPPEKYMAYEVSRFDSQPAAFLYSYASNYQALVYFKHDALKSTPASTLASIRSSLSKSIPCMFGFVAYESIKTAIDGLIPFPSSGEKVLGGHAVMCCGYDDSLKIGKYTGALLIRNSWGTSWGLSGYGWLPYEYVLKGKAMDFWSLLKNEWVDGREFGI